MDLPEHAIKLLSASGFDQEFFRNLAKSKTKKEAYEKTEETYRSFFKKRRYSSFDSYRVARDYRISSRR